MRPATRSPSRPVARGGRRPGSAASHPSRSRATSASTSSDRRATVTYAPAAPPRRAARTASPIGCDARRPGASVGPSSGPMSSRYGPPSERSALRVPIAGVDAAAGRRQAQGGGEARGRRVGIGDRDEDVVDLDDHAARLRSAGGGGGIRTHEPEGLRFSRPLRSTAPAPLRERDSRWCSVRLVMPPGWCQAWRQHHSASRTIPDARRSVGAVGRGRHPAGRGPGGATTITFARGCGPLAERQRRGPTAGSRPSSPLPTQRPSRRPVHRWIRTRCTMAS